MKERGSAPPSCSRTSEASKSALRNQRNFQKNPSVSRPAGLTARTRLALRAWRSARRAACVSFWRQSKRHCSENHAVSPFALVFQINIYIRVIDKTNTGQRASPSRRPTRNAVRLRWPGSRPPHAVGSRIALCVFCRRRRAAVFRSPVVIPFLRGKWSKARCGAVTRLIAVAVRIPQPSPQGCVRSAPDLPAGSRRRAGGGSARAIAATPRTPARTAAARCRFRPPQRA